MPPDANLSPQEETAILARLGMTQIDRVGQYAIYASSDNRRLLFRFTHHWDRLFNDLVSELARHGFSRAEVKRRANPSTLTIDPTHSV